MKRRILLGAGLGLAAARVCAVNSREEDEAFDVVVVGGGAAGLCAALSAAEQGASVVLLEKMSRIGGDTLISGGYFNAVDPFRQSGSGIVDSTRLFAEQILAAGRGLNDEDLARTLASESYPTLQWLEGLGLKFMPEVKQVYGSVHPRAHKPILPRGTGYIKILSQSAVDKGVLIRTGVKVVGFIRNPSTRRIEGVRTSRNGVVCSILARRGVVAAFGGFGAGKEMMRRHAPDAFNLPFDSHPGATGELFPEAEKAGAHLVNMHCVECTPGAAPEFSYQIRLDYFPSRMIIVDSRGRRFVDERAGRLEIAEAVLNASKSGPCYSIASSKALELFDPISLKNLYRGCLAGQAWYADSPRELAAKMNLPADELVREIEGCGEERLLKHPPIWGTRLYLRVHNTLGGIRIDSSARALTQSGSIVPGLYAAGQAAGNVHGAERIGGNGLADACTFGRIAGISAANFSS